MNICVTCLLKIELDYQQMVNLYRKTTASYCSVLSCWCSLCSKGAGDESVCRQSWCVLTLSAAPPWGETGEVWETSEVLLAQDAPDCHVGSVGAVGSVTSSEQVPNPPLCPVYQQDSSRVVLDFSLMLIVMTYGSLGTVSLSVITDSCLSISGWVSTHMGRRQVSSDKDSPPSNSALSSVMGQNLGTLV